MRKNFSVVLLTSLVASCFWGVDYSPEGRHDAFKTMYGRQVGTNSQDKELSWVARYPQDIIGQRLLPNGNAEVEFRTRNKECKVFYEVEPKNKIITAWRFEGGVKECQWVP